MNKLLLYGGLAAGAAYLYSRFKSGAENIELKPVGIRIDYSNILKPKIVPKFDITSNLPTAVRVQEFSGALRFGNKGTVLGTFRIDKPMTLHQGRNTVEVPISITALNLSSFLSLPVSEMQFGEVVFKIVTLLGTIEGAKEISLLKLFQGFGAARPGAPGERCG